jgi:hypothetical protein
VDNRFESFDIQQQKKARRDEQHRLFRRNQAIGLLLAAAAVLAWRLAHIPGGWLFTPGWWRLW